MPEHDEKKTYGGESIVTSWVIIGIICSWVIAWGFFLYFSIGDKWPPGWDYRIVKDVPGQSEYSTERAREFFGAAPRPATGAPTGGFPEGQPTRGELEAGPVAGAPEPQHVSRPENEFQRMIRQGAMK